MFKIEENLIFELDFSKSIRTELIGGKFIFHCRASTKLSVFKLIRELQITNHKSKDLNDCELLVITSISVTEANAKFTLDTDSNSLDFK